MKTFISHFRSLTFLLCILIAIVLIPQKGISQTRTVICNSASDIRRALENAQPGDDIVIRPGTYTGTNNHGNANEGVYAYFTSNRDGTADRPITIRGESPNNRPTLQGNYVSSKTVLNIRGDHWIIKDLVLTFASQGILIQNANRCQILNVEIYNLGQEAIHIIDGSDHTLIDGCYVHDIGKVNPQWAEAVYIGTTSQKHYQPFDPACDYTILRNSRIGPNVGAEGVDIKSRTKYTLIENNVFDGKGISGQNGGDSFIDIKGDLVTIRCNTFNQNGASKLLRAVETSHRGGSLTNQDHAIHDNIYNTQNPNIPLVSKRYATKRTYVWDNTLNPSNTRVYQNGGGFDAPVLSCCPAFYPNPVKCGSNPDCSTPSGLGTQNISQTSASLRWSAASGATDYDLRYRASGGSWQTIANRTGGTYTLSGLQAQTRYEWQIRSNCSGENSAYSASQVFSTLGNQPPGDNDIYLEAECATVGSAFESLTSSAASQNSYIRVKEGNNSYSSAPGSSNQRVRFSFPSKGGSGWKLRARVWGPNDNDDSFWVRINEGTWYQWRSGLNTGSSFDWATLKDNLGSGSDISFTLNNGNNTVDFSYREDGTGLDKIMLTQTNSPAPGGSGPEASNCTPPCSAPTNLSTKNIQTSSVNLSWTGVSQASNYDIQYRVSGGAWVSLPDRTGSSLTLNSLQASTPYEWQIRSSCGGEHSAYVKGSPFKTLDQPNTAENIFLEAECATVGSVFEIRNSSKASNGKYAWVKTGNNSNTSPPGSSQQRVRFNFTAPGGAGWRIRARAWGPSSGDDSFWVRVNGGTWLQWRYGLYSGSDFAWATLKDQLGAGEDIQFTLNKGPNTIDFAFREDGSGLDKLMLTQDNSAAPSDMGPTAENCQTPPESSTIVYGDALASDWANWSFKGAYQLSYYNQTKVGSRAIRAAYNAWGGLFLKKSSPMPVNQGTAIRFWIKGEGNYDISLRTAESGNDPSVIANFSINTSWQQKTIYMGQLGNPSSIDRIIIKNQSASDGRVVYIDHIEILGNPLEAGSSLGFKMAEEELNSDAQAPQVNIYPNPAERLNSQIHVDMTYVNPDYPVEIRVIDIYGRVLKEERISIRGNSSSYTLSLPADWAAGYYTLIVESNNLYVANRFVRK